MAPQTSIGVNNVEANSSGPYTPAKERDGRVIREETVEQVYRISGTGLAPKFDPNDMVRSIHPSPPIVFFCFPPDTLTLFNKILTFVSPFKSLQSTVDKCIRDTERIPRVQMVEANVLVKETEPLPQAIMASFICVSVCVCVFP